MPTKKTKKNDVSSVNFIKDFDLSIESSVNDWIQQIVPGKSFADLGGLWNTVKERVSVAALNGAVQYTMMDISPMDNKWWQAYRKRLSEFEVIGAKEIELNCMDLDAVKKVEPVDVLHCNGIIYHIPNYFEFIRNIIKLSKEYIILGSQVVPNKIENEFGSIEFQCPGLLPNVGLNPSQKQILKQHYAKISPKIVRTDEHPRPNLADDDFLSDFGPWFWFFTPEYLYNLLIDFGLQVIDHKCTWRGWSYSFLCRKAVPIADASFLYV
ncbi:MAG: class I SAM-dependent methyltransferase [Defluviitaleaceae bacterium]|nr:class I SAM-dependent methyltransferase [Defluviitaleaceae bacterium]